LTEKKNAAVASVFMYCELLAINKYEIFQSMKKKGTYIAKGHIKWQGAALARNNFILHSTSHDCSILFITIKFVKKLEILFSLKKKCR
jgi:hypothetical protein